MEALWDKKTAAHRAPLLLSDNESRSALMSVAMRCNKGLQVRNGALGALVARIGIDEHAAVAFERGRAGEFDPQRPRRAFLDLLRQRVVQRDALVISEIVIGHVRGFADRERLAQQALTGADAAGAVVVGVLPRPYRAAERAAIDAGVHRATVAVGGAASRSKNERMRRAASIRTRGAGKNRSCTHHQILVHVVFPQREIGKPDPFPPPMPYLINQAG